MALHFTPAEFSQRMNRTLSAMAQEKLDAILLFQQESMYWLTGYDTFGFCFFQCLVLRADGRHALLTRSADLRQAERTSTITDIRIWKDGAEANPVGHLADIVTEFGLSGKSVGVEYESYGLVASNGRKLDATVGEVARLKDASTLITRLRSVKSDAEIACVRKAAALCDLADVAAIDLIRCGADEGDILAAQHNAIFRGGGDYPANEFIIGSGADALLCRYKAGRRKLDENDQITLEFAGVYRHYHVAAMRTHLTGRPRDLHRRYHAAAKEALLECQDSMRPGATAGDVFAAHTRVFDRHGLSNHRLNACGYSLGAKFTPSWMDWPMFYQNNPWILEPGMVLFAHMILMDSETETAMCLGRTYLVTEGMAEALNIPSLELVIR